MASCELHTPRDAIGHAAVPRRTGDGVSSPRWRRLRTEYASQCVHERCPTYIVDMHDRMCTRMHATVIAIRIKMVRGARRLPMSTAPCAREPCHALVRISEAAARSRRASGSCSPAGSRGAKSRRWSREGKRWPPGPVIPQWRRRRSAQLTAPDGDDSEGGRREAHSWGRRRQSCVVGASRHGARCRGRRDQTR